MTADKSLASFNCKTTQLRTWISDWRAIKKIITERQLRVVSSIKRKMNVCVTCVFFGAVNENQSSAAGGDWIMNCTMKCRLLLLVRRENFVLHRSHYLHWYRSAVIERSLFIRYVPCPSCTIVQYLSIKSQHFVFIFKIPPSPHWIDFPLISLKGTVNIFIRLLFIYHHTSPVLLHFIVCCQCWFIPFYILSRFDLFFPSKNFK